jgi:hypothetical protein
MKIVLTKKHVHPTLPWPSTGSSPRCSRLLNYKGQYREANRKIKRLYLLTLQRSGTMSIVKAYDLLFNDVIQ